MHNSIALVAAATGTGTTIISLNLAAALAAHAETLLIEANMALPSLSQFLGAEFPFHLQGALSKECTWEQARYTHPQGFRFLPSTKEWDAPQPFHRIQDALKEHKPFTPHIIVDSPPLDALGFKETLKACDSCILISTPQTSHQADELAVEAKQHRCAVLGVVQNLQPPNSPELFPFQGLPVLAQFAFSRGLQRPGIPQLFVEHPARSALHRSIRHLAHLVAEPNL